jgi:hypothetical protein
MRFFLAVFLSLVGTFPSFALSISAEVERGFRYFKFNSDFEFQRLAYKDFQNKHGGQKPTILQLDEMLADLNWWYGVVHTKTAAWYGHTDALTPIKLLEAWRLKEIADEKRAPGYLELAVKLHAKGLGDWEYNPVRIGWSSLLFPAHQTPGDLGNDRLLNAADVGVCWNRAEQAHTNCGGLDAYLSPAGYTVWLRAIEADDTRILNGDCNWEIDMAGGAKFVRPKDVTGGNLRAPCNDHVSIVVPAGKQVAVKLQTNAGQADKSVKIEDQLVVGVGDSFSSGEGNPDVPAKLGWTSNKERDWAADGKSIVDEVTSGPVRKAVGDYFAAQWIDRSCHRSAYSYQLRSALHLALENSAHAITFLSYACSGAEVNEGLFQPFQGPEFTQNKDGMDAYQQAQFPLLLSELCKKYNGDAVLDEPLTESTELRAIAADRYKLGGVISDKAYRCANQPAGAGFKRPIDLMYISIGGNDLGFAKWIMAAITSEGSFGSFFPILKEDGDPGCRSHSGSCKETRSRWKRLTARYALLRDFVDHRLDFSKRDIQPVLLFTYPVPARTADGSLCPLGNDGMSIFAPRINEPGPKVCLSRDQKGLATLETISDFTNGMLNQAIERLVGQTDANGAARPGWQAVADYRPKFSDRGFCASRVRELSGNTAPAEPYTGCKSARQTAALVEALSLSGPAVQETLHFPIGFRNGVKDWGPFDPVYDYRPYHHRARLLRTMNETYFVINQLTGGTQANKASGVLSLKDAAVYGAFHPTAEAHAIFADDFFVKGNEILQKPRQ